MEIISASASSPLSTGTIAANPASANAAGSTDSAGFSQLLVQVMGGQGEATGNATMPNLNYLLNGLASLLTGASTEAVEGGFDSAMLQDLLKSLADQPDLLEKLLGDGDLQAWLLQASELLQGLGVLPVFSTQTAESAGDQAADEASAAKHAISLQQAQTIMAVFAKTVQEQPGSVMLGQLQEKLAALLAAHPELQQGGVKRSGDGHAASSDRTAGADPSAASGSSGRILHTDRNTAYRDAAASGVEGFAAKVQLSPVTAHPNRLEILAAKANMAGRADLAQMETGAALNTAVALEGEETGTIPALTFQQELARMPQSAKDGLTQAFISSDNLVEELSRFVSGRLKVQTFSGLTEARLSLTPESLGHVVVRLTMQNGQLVAHFAAQTAAGKEMLEAQLPQLRQALQNQGIQVEKMDVSQSLNLQSGMFHDQRHQQGSQQFARSSSSDASYGEPGAGEFSTELEEVRGRQRDTGHEGFDVTA